MNLAERVAQWAARDQDVQALWLIGSQARAIDDELWRADPQSDWDFQLVARHPERFADSKWTGALGLALRNYAVRRAAIGGMPKIAALFDGADVDLVVLSASRMRLARFAVALGWHRRSAGLRRRLQDLAVVVRPGWRMFKGGRQWQRFLERVVAEVPDPRLSDAEACALAAGFVSDAVWIRRKIERGELLAAQRMIHRSLVETNLRLLHELRLRRGQRSFPEGRRAEQVLSADEWQRIVVSTELEPGSLRAAVEKSSAACRELVQALVGDAWRWPE